MIILAISLFVGRFFSIMLPFFDTLIAFSPLALNCSTRDWRFSFSNNFSLSWYSVVWKARNKIEVLLPASLRLSVMYLSNISLINISIGIFLMAPFNAWIRGMSLSPSFLNTAPSAISISFRIPLSPCAAIASSSVRSLSRAISSKGARLPNSS